MKNNTAPKIIQYTDLKGRDWLYSGAVYHVLEVQDNGTLIFTDKRRFKFATVEERDYFLASLKPSEAPSASPPVLHRRTGITIIADKESDDMFEKILGELQYDFDKMKGDPSYVPIAKQRANQANTMTNMIKTKILLERLNRSR